MLDNRKVAQAGLLMASVLALCRFASLGKELYVASLFGAGVVIDAYSLAILVPAVGVSLFVNAVRRAYLAQYPSFQAQGEAAAERFANQYLTSLLAVAVGLSLAISLGLNPFWPKVVAGHRPDVIESLRMLTLPAAWLIVPMAAVSGLTAVLNARQHFSSPQWTHVIPTAAVAGFVVAVGRDWGARALLWGLLSGTVLQSVVLLGMLSRSGHRPRLVFDVRSRTVAALWSLSVPIILLDTLGQGNVYVDRTMASTLAAGKISVLYWSALMKDFVSGTLIASLLWVLLPHFSQQVSGGKTDELRRSCGLVLRYAALLMFPMTALLIMCGPPLFDALQLGALDQAATASLAGCLAAYAVGLFAELSSPALAQALLVLGNRQAGWDGLRVLVVVGIFGSFIPNILFNLLLIGPFAEVGLAASTSLVAWLSLAVHYYLLRRTIGMHEESRCLKSVAGALLAACLAAGAGFTLLAGLERFDSPMLANGVVRATAAAFALLAVYVVLLFVYPGNDDARLVCRIVRDKLRSSSDRE